MNFTAFQHSVFLQSLGWAITNSVWQAGVCWVLYHIVVASYTTSSKFKNNLSTILLFSTFLWFIATFFNKFIYLQNKTAAALPNQLIFSTDFNFVSSSNSLQNFTHAIGITLPYLSVAYLLLLLIFTAKLVNSYHATIFLRYNGLQKPGVEWRLFVEKVAGHMDVTKKIKLWFSKYVDVPATIGFLKPVILIPVASLNQLTADQLEAIILHELSHIKRNDYLINLFISLIETVLFFNPFIVLLSKIIKKERENCCDDFVLQYQYDRHSYASALLSLEKSRNQNMHLVLTATSDKKQLLFRIKRIMEVKNNGNSLNYGQKLIALLLVTAIISSIACLSPAKNLNRPYNNKQLSAKNLNIRPGINNENIGLTSKNAASINSIAPLRTIKNNPITIINISKENNPPEKNEEPLFRLKINDDQIENNPPLMNLDNSDVVASGATMEPPVSADNAFFLPKSSLSDLNSFYKFYFDIDINKLKTEIEKTNQSFSSINWDTIQQEIVENLEKIKITAPRINARKKQITSTIDKLEKEKEKNAQKDFLFSFINENANNFPPKVKINFGDSLFTKDNAFDNEKDRTVYRQSNRNNSPDRLPRSEKRPGKIKIPPPVFNYPEAHSFENKMPAGLYVNPGRKPLRQSVQIAYKNGSIVINGKKISSPELKKYQAQGIIAKLLQDCNSPVVEIETEN